VASKVVVITGSSSGIGEATARRYGASGARVAVLARNAGRLAAVAESIRKAGGDVTPYTVDLSDRRATGEIGARISRELGAPDILINNAGVGRFLPMTETTADEALAMIEVPYLAGFTLTRAFLPAMLARRSGAIAFITSPASYLAWPRASAYIAARRAVAGLAESLQSELKGTGIVVSLVVLGEVKTPYWEHNPGSRDNMPKIEPRLVPLLTPDEAASAIVEGIDAKRPFVVKPALLRAFFVLNALFPRLVARQLRRATGKPSARTQP
jgi:short-subunit dehydrogenase